MSHCLSIQERAPATSSPPSLLGLRVQIKARRADREAPRYSGCRGVVARESLPGVWYVTLDATKRAKSRQELFRGEDLQVLSLEEACKDLRKLTDEATLIAAHQSFQSQFASSPDAIAELASSFTHAHARILWA